MDGVVRNLCDTVSCCCCVGLVVGSSVEQICANPKLRIYSRQEGALGPPKINFLCVEL